MLGMRTAFLLIALVASPSMIAGAEDPVTITTDTPEYCIGLADRMRAEGDMPPHARLLWHNGLAMCEHGQVRDGLARLRRAMLMMRGAAE
jgi:hypothetical protein